VLACITLLAARGFGGLWRHDRVMAAMAVAAMVMVSGYLLAEALRVNLRLTEEDRRLYAPVASENLDRALVLVPPMWGPHLLHPFAWLRNEADYDGPTVFALDRGEPANLALLDSFPLRVPYRLRVHGSYRASPADPALTSSLERLTLVERPALEADLILRNETGDPYVSLSVTVNGRRDTFVLDTSSGAGERYEARIRIGADAVGWSGPFEAHADEQVAPDDSMSVSISMGPSGSATPRTVYLRQFAYAVRGPVMKVLLPGVVSVDELGGGSSLTIGAGG